MKYDDAIALGAMHLFGEKYGDVVRVVTIGQDGWSRELCGGTHVSNVGVIGQVTILSEASVGTGTRRVDALVGKSAYEYNAREHALVSQLSDSLNARPIPSRRRCVRRFGQREKFNDERNKTIAQGGTFKFCRVLCLVINQSNIKWKQRYLY